MNSRPTQASSESVAASRRALAHLFSEYQRARAERDVADARLANFSETIQLLIDGLPPKDQAELAGRFAALVEENALASAAATGSPSPSGSGRGGEVFSNVVA